MRLEAEAWHGEAVLAWPQQQLIQGSRRGYADEFIPTASTTPWRRRHR
jgi:hypothetical protein